MATYYIANREISPEFILSAIETLRHYKGRFRNVSLENISAEYPDAPDSGGGGTTFVNDVIRSGSMAVNIGSNVVVFSSPLPSDNYVVSAYVKSASESQMDLGVITKTASGFTVSDVLINGVLYYHVIMNV